MFCLHYSRSPNRRSFKFSFFTCPFQGMPWWWTDTTNRKEDHGIRRKHSAIQCIVQYTYVIVFSIRTSCSRVSKTKSGEMRNGNCFDSCHISSAMKEPNRSLVEVCWKSVPKTRESAKISNDTKVFNGDEKSIYCSGGCYTSLLMIGSCQQNQPVATQQYSTWVMNTGVTYVVRQHWPQNLSISSRLTFSACC